MDGFYESSHPQQERRGQMGHDGMEHRQTPTTLSDAALSSQNMDDTTMIGGDSLDDIIRDNHEVLQRRRSSLNNPFPAQGAQNSPTGGVPMMGYADGSNAFQNYPFQADGMGADFATMASGIQMPDSAIPLSQTEDLHMTDRQFQPMPPNMMADMMPPSYVGMNMSQLGPDEPGLDFFGATQMGSQFARDPTTDPQDGFAMGHGVDGGGVGSMEAARLFGGPQVSQGARDPLERRGSNPQPAHQGASGVVPYGSDRPTSFAAAQVGISQGPERRPETRSTPSQLGNKGHDSSMNPYSRTGFDLLRCLWLVMMRPTQDVHLGPVDMSCAFVVCDTTMNDCPIIYVSENFQNLTGYNHHEILGKNCRFLQAPGGNVEAGVRREFVDDGAVYNLKEKIAQGKEVQQSLINYRKGGQPFLNLLTMIPIPEGDMPARYFIGFQIDIVECPDAVTYVEGGALQVNYKPKVTGQYTFEPPPATQWGLDTSNSLTAEDVTALLRQYDPKGVMSEWHKSSWERLLLETSDDVIHVLSLKGVFQYVSPACKRVLGWDPWELNGQSLSRFCHPSDIVPITRELKESSATQTVNIVFRMQLKDSGYTWFESYGTLVVEQLSKSRKCMILVGRRRPVLFLDRRLVDTMGGFGDAELWTKLSTSGMFLYVSSNVRSLLDLQPESLVGTTIHELMRRESRPEFGRAIEKARKGQIVACQHEVQNRRGQVLQAETILYPGDSERGVERPTFLLAQTKLIKGSPRAFSSSSLAHDGLSSGALFAEALKLQRPTYEVPHEDNLFDELRTTRGSSWQFELRQLQKLNRMHAEDLQRLLANKKKRKRRKGVGNIARDCANCHTRSTPEWRRGPSGNRDLCNSCGLRWAKQTGRVSPRTSSRGGNGGNMDSQSKHSTSPIPSSPLHKEMVADMPSATDEDLDRNTVGGNEAHAGASPVIDGDSQHSMPPLSQPLLEGGSGANMTSIREEMETNIS